MSRFILASKSPRRKEILTQVGIEFDIVVSDKEEVVSSSVPCEVVMELSKQKALEVQEKIKEDEYIILSADTIVAIGDVILGKPKDREDAFNMIKNIQGRTHSVYTGVTLIKNSKTNKKINTFFEETKVNVYSMTDEEINDYLDKSIWKDKAGSYGIQGEFASYVKGIEGDYYTVVGLPISRVVYELKQMN